VTRVLYDPAKAMDTFVLTPEYDALTEQWANQNPDHPDPRFTSDECRPLTFRWPNDSAEVARIRRDSNGRFAKKDA